MRFALGVDDDLRPFYDRFRDDPLIGRSVRARPHLRVHRRPEPFEALAWAICEQLIEFERAAAIERRIVRALGPPLPADRAARPAVGRGRSPAWRPARLQSLRPARPAARWRCAAPRARSPPAASTCARPTTSAAGGACGRSPASARWTIEMLALHGQGRYDQIPAGDVGYLKLVGRLRAGRRPHGRATEDEVRAFFAPYEGWAGLAGAHALAHGVGVRVFVPASPSPGRNSFVSARPASAGCVISLLCSIQSP